MGARKLSYRVPLMRDYKEIASKKLELFSKGDTANFSKNASKISLYYYPACPENLGFGMLACPVHTGLPNRHESSNEYRYGFQGQEKDDEVSGEGNSYTAEYWQYDSRLGRRWNIDPVVKEHESPYATFANNPIWFADPNGADTNTVSVVGGTLSLPTGVSDIVTNEENQVTQFTFDNLTYTASYSEGKFNGYRTSEGKLYKGESIFNNTPWYYVDNSQSPDNITRWPVYSGEVTTEYSEYKKDEVATRLTQATLAIGVTRLKSLVGISGTTSDVISAGLTLSGATKFTVKSRTVYQTTTAVDWYGIIQVNPFTDEGYVVPTGTSDEYTIRVGVAKIQYQLYFNGEPVEGATWFDTIDVMETPTSSDPPTVTNKE